MKVIVTNLSLMKTLLNKLPEIGFTKQKAKDQQALRHVNIYRLPLKSIFFVIVIIIIIVIVIIIIITSLCCS
eukprot:2912524-Karenia_brevis.AAC.1